MAWSGTFPAFISWLGPMHQCYWLTDWLLCNMHWVNHNSNQLAGLIWYIIKANQLEISRQVCMHHFWQLPWQHIFVASQGGFTKLPVIQACMVHEISPSPLGSRCLQMMSVLMGLGPWVQLLVSDLTSPGQWSRVIDTSKRGCLSTCLLWLTLSCLW